MGAAVGDALAFPYAGLSPIFTGSLGRESVQSFRAHRSGNYPVGQGSHFVQLTLAVVEALSEGDLAVTADRIGSYIYPLARDRLLVAPPPGLLASLEGWARGRTSPRVNAEPPVHLLPLALLEWGSAEALGDDLIAAARSTGHDSPEGLAMGAAFLAAARFSLLREDIVLGDLIDETRNLAGRFSPRVAEDLGRIPDLLCVSERDGIGPHAGVMSSPAVFQVVAGLISFLKSPHDCGRSYLIAQRSGAGCAAAFVCGALGGAFNGEAKIPPVLRETVSMRAEVQRRASALLEHRRVLAD
jgi:hypothetical protein